jgi:hypothetical protein
MKKLFIYLALLFSPIPMFATFGSGTAWDVRTTGVDTNGGAFEAVGSPGTDESQGAGTAITVTLTGTTTGTGSPAFTSTTHGPGNFIHIGSGTGCTVGWYEILSQSGGIATFDHAMGAAANVCVGNIGGSLLTIQQANTNSTASNTIHIQTGTYTFTASLTLLVASLNFIGYQATHGDDGTKPLITTSTNSVTLINTGSSTNGTDFFRNISFSNTAATPLSGIWQLSAHGSGQAWVVLNCKFDGFQTAIDSSNVTPDDVAFIYLVGTEITNSTNAVSLGGTTIQYFYTYGSYFHANGIHLNGGLNLAGGLAVIDSIFSGGTVTGSPNIGATYYAITGNAFYNSALALSYVAQSSMQISNNIFWGSGVILNIGGAANPVAIMGLIGMNNAYGGGGTTTGFTKNYSAITLTANPFTNAGSGDFSLNNTAGGGALLRQLGFPTKFGTSTTSGISVGPAQTPPGGVTAGASNFGSSN